MSPIAPLPCGLLAACLVLPAMSHAATVLVEDFESPDTANYITFTAGQTIVTATNSWLVVLNSVDLYEDSARAEAAAYDGAQAVDLTGSPGEGTIETTFPTDPGSDYELVFHYARNDLLGGQTGDARVEVEGASLVLTATIQHDPAQLPFDAYQTFTDVFTADSTECTLRFISLDPGNTGITVDAIAITTSSDVGAEDGVATSSWGELKARFQE